MASSSKDVTSFETELVEIIRTMGRNVSGSQKYHYPSHVNAASFVSIKLQSKDNYRRWQEQMTCLLDSHSMLGFINGTTKNPMNDAEYEEWKRSDTLVKGWIFGSLSENVMGTVVGLPTANDVWEKLKTIYTIAENPNHLSGMKMDLGMILRGRHAQKRPPGLGTDQSGRPLRTNRLTTASSNSIKKEYRPLYRAIMRNDRGKAQEIIKENKDALTAELNFKGESALHIAIDKAENVVFFENLLMEINRDSLEALVANCRYNPLHRAALVDNHRAAEMLVKKNPRLLFILDEKYLPIERAVLNSHRTTFLYLLGACKQYIELSQQHGCVSPFEGIRGAVLLVHAIASGFFDVAEELIMEYPEMATTKSASMFPLTSIARMRDSYYSATRYNFYERFVYRHVPTKHIGLHKRNMSQDIENQHANFITKCRNTSFSSVIKWINVKIWRVSVLHVPHIKHLQKEKRKHNQVLVILKHICKELGKKDIETDIREHYQEALRLAVLNDIPEVIEEITESFPDAIWTVFDGYNLIQLAIKNRCEKVYNFLVSHMSNDKYAHEQRKDKDDNNLFHLAGQLAPIHKFNAVSGAALQLQRELQWFEEVGKFVKPKYKEQPNKKGETPIMVFRREHMQMRKEGEEWMKKTSDSYTITAALIITIVFAAAITVPGGNNENNGKAIYATKPSFIIFAVSDAISLFTSTTSLLLFLSVLTARYEDVDFRYKLPKRLILGLLMLFISVTSLMVAFSATLYLMFGNGEAWILIPIATLTCLPIASFVTLQLPLLVDLISSTYGRGIFAKKSDHRMKQSRKRWRFL